MWSDSGYTAMKKGTHPRGESYFALIEMGREINTILQVLLGFVLESVCILITCVSERWINLKW